jgi:hypothetical protein
MYQVNLLLTYISQNGILLHIKWYGRHLFSEKRLGYDYIKRGTRYYQRRWIKPSTFKVERLFRHFMREVFTPESLTSSIHQFAFVN